MLWAGTASFGEERGEVWGAHLAWSGNSRVNAERLPDGRAVLQLGELLLPGEVVLAPGESYRTPAGVRRALPRRPQPRQPRSSTPCVREHQPTAPRPVVLNTWEAVYFDHDFDTLVRLADARRGSASSGSSSTTDGSGAVATTGRASATGGSHRTPIPTVWRR